MNDVFFRLSMLLCSREARPQAETYAPRPPPRAARLGSVRTRCQRPRPNTAAFCVSYPGTSHERALQHTRLVEEFMLRSEFSGQMDDFAKMEGASRPCSAVPSLFVLMMSADVIHHGV